VNAFLSVASKAAALALLIRVCIGIGYGSPSFAAKATPAETPPAVEVADDGLLRTHPVALLAQEEGVDDPLPPPPAEPPANLPPGEEVYPHDLPAGEESSSPSDAVVAAHPLAGTQDFIAKLVALFAVVTCTFGNLAAYGQTNIKRLLAYSTIAHAGYMMMPVPALMALGAIDPSAARNAIAGLGLYMAVYLFMNLGAFAAVAFLRNSMKSEEIADYAGLIRRAPGVVICLSLMLFSLVGLPPLSGFIGKFAIFASLAEGYQVTGQNYLLWLLIIGGVNTAISLFYYLNLVKVMTIDSEPATRLPLNFPIVSLSGMYLLAITLPTAGLMLGWDGLNNICRTAVQALLT
jgi:NADH-quinone oxidoreductase subunit N